MKKENFINIDGFSIVNGSMKYLAVRNTRRFRSLYTTLKWPCFKKSPVLHYYKVVTGWAVCEPFRILEPGAGREGDRSIHQTPENPLDN